MAARRNIECEYPPGAQVQRAGVYEQRNVLGTPTGLHVNMAQGEVLPAAPRGFTWSRIEPQCGSALG